jgi:hypothetical protein
MINVCDECGRYEVAKIIDGAGPFAVCPHCGHRHPFRQLPLLLVCGPSTTGKSTVCRRIAGALDGVVVLDGDILWQPPFNRPQDNYRHFFETWLRLAKNIGQSGTPLVLFNAGAIPGNVEPCLERRYFSATHYLALTCDDDCLTERLKQRQAWRGCTSQTFISEQIAFNNWLKENVATTAPPTTLLNTAQLSIEATATQVTTWIRQRLASERA